MNDTVTTAVPGSAPRIRNLPSESVIAPSVVPSMGDRRSDDRGARYIDNGAAHDGRSGLGVGRAGKESMLSMKKNDVSRVMS